MLGELEPAEIDEMLRSEVIGRIGCHADGRSYVVPVTYAYDGDCLYCHSGAGLKLEMMRANPHVCFEVDRHDDLANWRSVIAWGVFKELDGAEAEHALGLLATRLRPLLGDAGFPHGAQYRAPGALPPVVYRIKLLERSGRCEGSG
jgi:nitroimidazol reductase NimA-like FMN-containing flavoprotein (pyridoxamine 5'-phosphate oxidase superfamily)